MSKKQAVVQESDGVVENVILADDSFDPGSGLTLVALDGRRVSKGDTYDFDTDEFIEDDSPTPTLPEAVRRDKVSSETRQAFKDARSSGDLQTQLDSLYEILTGEELV